MSNILILRMKNADFNIGEQAVLASILNDLSQLKNSHVEVLGNTTRSLNQRIGSTTSHSYFPTSRRTLQAIAKANVLVWAGGNMLQDESSVLDIPYHLANIFFAQALRIPIILYGVEIGPINTKMGSFFSAKALNKIDLIIVRNKRSATVLKTLGVNNPNVHITADPAFLVPPQRKIVKRIQEKYGIQHDRPVVGVAPRKAFYKVTGWMPATLRQKLNLMPPGFHDRFSVFKTKMAQICDYLIAKFGVQILFLPMDVAENPRDDLVCREIRDNMSTKQDTFILEPGLTPSEIAGVIASLDLVISQRLHALILSCSVGTPMIGISSTGNKDKCKVFMRDIEQQARCIDVSTMINNSKAEYIFNLLNTTWENYEYIKNQVTLKSRELKAKSSMNIDIFNNWLQFLSQQKCLSRRK